MRLTKYAFILSAALGIYAPLQVPALAQAGFDCGKASSATEKAICSKPDIAEADRAMSLAYSALLERSSPALKTALRNDQAAFIKTRSEAFESNLSNLDNRLTGLHDRTEMRAEFLNWVSVVDNTSLEGKWSNAWGVINVEKDQSGKLTVSLDVADQANGTWVCSFSGALEQKSASEAEFKGDGGPLVLRLDGATLNVPTPFCDETTSGRFGTAAGTYFRMGAP